MRAGEAEYFHTRQQHTLKVAQVGRRLAEFVGKQTPRLARNWGIHPEVVEAACLAHDLGHPPFGHIGEHTLNRLVEAAGDFDGFEGNAQSFRIATRIGVRFDQDPGFDLTRATLAAILKYPWLRDLDDPKRSKKWSCYESDKDAFLFARKYHEHDDRQTAEAALMDWADDIAYSVHDLEDFHRAGVIPWHLIFHTTHSSELVRKAQKAWFGAPSDAKQRLEDAVARLAGYFAGWEVIIEEPYDGSRYHRVALRALTSTLIGRYVQATRLNPDMAGQPVIRGEEEEAEIYILKQITRDYVITSPTLLAQQHGQQRIIQGLYSAISEGAVREKGRPGFLPVRLSYLWDEAKFSIPRFAADCIASLTEGQATALYGRLYGTAAGSVLDPIVR
ncbi:dGTPase [Sphingomonas melonis]|uniref:dGTPase n=1 Tax=Sphingomonas melonis TaxID=152682 RepID=A0A7Y9FL25_9SPHN|nr:dGTPase [Sphingomonas melonis]